MAPNKSLGQHWLKDGQILAQIVQSAQLSSQDVVLEIGPGLGTLTSRLLQNAKEVVAVEFDQRLAHNLSGQFPGKNLKVFNQDILQFDLSKMPANYKVVANVPYYITSKIVQLLLTAQNSPSLVVLLVQKEVAERLAAKVGKMSLLSLSAQVFAEVSLGVKVPARFFTPPPKVDSQVVILKIRQQSLVEASQQKNFFRVASAGFSARRKKLRSSLAGGLGLSKSEIEKLLHDMQISPDLRAQDLSVSDWQKISEQISH